MQDNSNSSSKLVAMSGEEDWWLKKSGKFYRNTDEERCPLEKSDESQAQFQYQNQNQNQKTKTEATSKNTQITTTTATRNKTHKSDIVIKIGKLFAILALLGLYNQLIVFQFDRVSVVFLFAFKSCLPAADRLASSLELPFQAN